MAEKQKCTRCGAELPAHSPCGHCLNCLLQFGLMPPEDDPDESLAANAAATTFDSPSAEKPGDHIGRFRLIKQIGEGGFGVVFKAEQEEPVRRFVALKVIKLGMDTKEVVARFESERQALALMDHPNIAKVLDGGTTTTGRPYFVMELVDGARITDYCDAQQLTVRQRLELFIQVCQAVQHAHQKGIIHRDIKPSNILVAEQDGVPTPKVIDFGIAKATMGHLLTEETAITAFQQFAGTPAYMSPEQAGMGGQDIDARSDIYSLGMLLYELLTAQPAFETEDLRRSALEEILRTIREKEPPRPSTRLITLKLQKLTTVAQCRQTEPAKLTNLVRGDLDWIVMKALEKDRNRRYETANGLATDIQRHLNNEPVVARPPSRLYRIQKLARRNKLTFAAGATVIAALVLGLGLSTLMYFREAKARHHAIVFENAAKREAAKSQEVARFLKDMLAGVGPDIALGRDTQLLRSIVEKTSERLGSNLGNQPEVEADLRNTLGNLYHDLGEFQKAESMHRRALDLEKASSKETLNVAASLNGLAVALDQQGKLPEAEAAHREALDLRRKLPGAAHADVALSLSNLGNVLWRQNKLAEAESLYREALTMNRKLLGNEHEQTAGSLGNLAMVLASQSRPAEAEPIFREALALQRKILGNEHPVVAKSLSNLALALGEQGKADEAEAFFREALALRKKILGSEHPALAYTLNNLANLLAAEGKFDEAEAMHREALAIRRKLLGNEHSDTAVSLDNLAIVLDQQGKLAEAETLRQEALAIRKKLQAR